ncbi:MAG: amidase [Ilumatobacteraceae bacterium]|nr:amidase [Ilumatobacteraceae bacterium]
MSLTHLSVRQQAELLASGEVSSVDLVRASLERIATVQPVLNCFVEVWAEEALARAASLGPHDGRPLHGIPVAIKDTTPWEGHRVTYGSMIHRENIANRSAIVVERLLEAGAVIVGSTTAPEFAHAGITDSPLHGATRNPWDTTRTTGGSSGGSAAAVSSGCVAVAEGSDMGGSVRIPAAWCGVVGLKPSLGRIPMNVLPGLWDTISHHGPLARTVDCAHTFMSAVSGPSLHDPLSHIVPMGNAHTDISGLRVAWSVDLGCWSVDRRIAAAVTQTVDSLRGAVASVVDAPALFSAEDSLLWLNMWGIFMAAYFGDEVDKHPDDADPDVVSLVQLGRMFSAVDSKRMEIARSGTWQRVTSVLAKNDVIICPTMSRFPGPAAKADNPFDLDRDVTDGLWHSEDMTTVWNLVSPLPVVSVPCGFGIDGDSTLPIGLQIVGRPGQEDVVLALAAWIEERSGVRDRRPLV